MSIIKKSFSRRSDDTIDYDSDDKDSKRKSRNLSEKKRRDQFNLLVNELSAMVTSGGRKTDKSTILKSAIAFLRNHNELTVKSRMNEIQEDWKPPFLTNEEFTHLILEAVGGFIMVFSPSGQINYISESIASLLGYLPKNILGTSIYELSNEEDHDNLNALLLNPSTEGQSKFSCYLRKDCIDAKLSQSYELVNFLGYFRVDENAAQSRQKCTDYSTNKDNSEGPVFVGTGKVVRSQLICEMSAVVEAARSEFTSRHSLEWKFLFLDHRAPPVIGYLPFELLGTSGYDYYHVDDLPAIAAGHRALMQKGEGTSCCHRFLTKGQQWIWLQTRYYITYHQWTSKPEFIVCTHKVVSYEDVTKQNTNLDKQKINPVSSKPPSPPVAPWRTSESKTNNSSAKWGARTENSRSCALRLPTPSECTSLSADSPASRHSLATQLSQKSRVSEGHHHRDTPTTGVSAPMPVISDARSPNSRSPLVHQSSQVTSTQQLAPPVRGSIAVEAALPPQSHYVAALPVQPVIARFPIPAGAAVISPMPVNDSVTMTSDQIQFQAGLHRKQIELQALIGQQQVELRKVSEQLLMARLGLLSSDHKLINEQRGESAKGSMVSSTTLLGDHSRSPGGMLGFPLLVPVSSTGSPLIPHQGSASEDPPPPQ